jgi:transcriptional regulator with PAS, ATPase and Fis domain
MPSLRERKDDIPGIAERLLKTFDYAHLPLSTLVLGALLEYAWPGNIRELRNMLERACLLARGQEIAQVHFPGLTLQASAHASGDNGSTMVNLDDMEKAHIRKVLDHCKGDKYKASEVLGISLSSLYRKLAKIEEPVSQ